MSNLAGILQRERSEARTIPMPLAIGGVGLLISTALPGGLAGGEGFLIGVFLGFSLIGAKLLFGRTMEKADHVLYTDPLSSSGEKIAAPKVRAPDNRIQILLRGE